MSLDHRLISEDDLVSQWRTVDYLAGPTEGFRIFEVSASDFGTVSMQRRYRAWVYEFFFYSNSRCGPWCT